MHFNSVHILLLIVVFAACSSMRVATFGDPSMSLASFQTYAWSNGQATTADQLDRLVREVVDRKMATKGYRLVTPDHSDLLIHYHAAVDENLDVATEYEQYRLGTDPYGRETSRAQVFKEGTLVLDVEKPTSRRLIWRGWATDAINDLLRAEEIKSKIDMAVDKILDRFPDCPRLEMVRELEE
jgi:hypothetical protein